MTSSARIMPIATSAGGDGAAAHGMSEFFVQTFLNPCCLTPWSREDCSLAHQIK